MLSRDDIIRMAREQGLPETEVEGVFRVNSDDLGRMLAAEREACLDCIRPNATPMEIAAAIRARGTPPCPDCHGIGYDASGQTCGCQD